MNPDTILSELKAHRDRLNRAISALEDSATDATEDLAARLKKGQKKVRKMSAEARKRIADAKRKWWAAQKRKLG